MKPTVSKSPSRDHTARVVVHPAITLMMRAKGLSLQGPLGTVHVASSLYDPKSVMALKHVHDEASGAVMHVHAPSKHVLKTFCSVFKSYMEGVTQGFMMHIEAVGVGYKMHVAAAVSNSSSKQSALTQVLTFRVGLSHQVSCLLPPDIKVFLPKPTQLLVFGIDKQRVSQVVAQLRAIKLPEPYKGKGLRRKMEHVLRKEGKKK